MIIDINIAITPNIGAESSKNKPKLKNKNPNLNVVSSFESSLLNKKRKYFCKGIFKIYFASFLLNSILTQ